MVTDKKIEARILSVFMDGKPWQAAHDERRIRRSALKSQMTGCWDAAEYASYCHGCGALSIIAVPGITTLKESGCINLWKCYKLNKDYLTGGVLKKRQPPFFCRRKREEKNE